jgi:hypothetical protein
MSNSLFPQYPWLIDYTDLTDVPIKSLGSNYFIINPNTTKNYYHLCADAMIDLANTKGVDVNMLNAVDPPHYLLSQWQIAYIQEQICIALIGTSDVEVDYDKYAIKQRIYHEELIQYQGKIGYETFITANMQQNYTRAAGRTFNVVY